MDVMSDLGIPYLRQLIVSRSCLLKKGQSHVDLLYLPPKGKEIDSGEPG